MLGAGLNGLPPERRRQLAEKANALRRGGAKIMQVVWELKLQTGFAWLLLLPSEVIQRMAFTESAIHDEIVFGGSRHEEEQEAIGNLRALQLDEQVDWHGLLDYFYEDLKLGLILERPSRGQLHR
jgi:hypothetical protein